MRFSYLLLLFSFLFFNFQTTNSGPRSARIANYEMDIQLDVENKKLFSQTQLTWQNTTSDTIHDLQFHLYYNAFKNSKSTFLSESGLPSLFRNELEKNNAWGWTEIKSMTDELGNDLAKNMHFIQPDDDNKNDETVLRVPLAQPILPNQSIKINYTWEAKIPRTMIRTGYNKDFYFFAQWYPKVGVYEPAGMRYATEGGWNCHQYHASGEYYGEFGNYEVSMTVPQNFKIASSGQLVDEQNNNASASTLTKTYTFQVNDVIDFAWGASPHFVEHKMNWKGVEIKLFTYPEHNHFKERYFEILPKAMDFFEEKFEKYPFPSLTIIAPPFHGIFTGGMEYSTLITTLSNCLLPTGVRSTEILTVHEFVHQYFQQIVATNEMEEAWLDEGITNYYEGRIMDLLYGEKTSTIEFMGIKAGNAEMDRASYLGMSNPAIAPNSLNSWEFPQNSYHTIQYSKSAVWLTTLERLIGSDIFDEVMKAYYLKWRFKHPSAKDFVNVVNDIVASKMPDAYTNSMDWFFQQVLYGTEICDYAVSGIDNKIKRTDAGYLNGNNNESTISKNQEMQGVPTWKSVVSINRLGDMILPIEILVKFDDGTEVLENWNGKATTHQLIYEGSSQVECVEIDPEHKIFLDKNFLNNSFTKKANKKGIRKYSSEFLFWLQNSMEGLNLFI